MLSTNTDDCITDNKEFRWCESVNPPYTFAFVLNTAPSCSHLIGPCIKTIVYVLYVLITWGLECHFIKFEPQIKHNQSTWQRCRNHMPMSLVQMRRQVCTVYF